MLKIYTISFLFLFSVVHLLPPNFQFPMTSASGDMQHYASEQHRGPGGLLHRFRPFKLYLVACLYFLSIMAVRRLISYPVNQFRGSRGNQYKYFMWG